MRPLLREQVVAARLSEGGTGFAQVDEAACSAGYSPVFNLMSSSGMTLGR